MHALAHKIPKVLHTHIIKESRLLFGKGLFLMMDLERKTDRIILDRREELRSMSCRDKANRPSEFLCMEDDRKSTIGLDVQFKRDFHVKINIDDIEL